MWLMLPGADFDKKVVSAMAELSLAFRSSSPSPSAASHVEKIVQIMGIERWQEHAQRMTPAERSELVTMFWELDRLVSREYYMDEARREITSIKAGRLPA